MRREEEDEKQNESDPQTKGYLYTTMGMSVSVQTDCCFLSQQHQFGTHLTRLATHWALIWAPLDRLGRRMDHSAGPLGRVELESDRLVGVK